MTSPRDGMPVGDPHRRPAGVSDEVVAAVGKLGEALEYVERARGHLYAFHQLIGRADLLFGEGADGLGAAGHGDFARRLRRELVGRNVLEGRWTFQVVEEYDDGYYSTAAELEREARHRYVGGARHVFEAEMKERRRSAGRPGHESRPRGSGTDRPDTT